jgi:hypothetical protein
MDPATDGIVPGPALRAALDAMGKADVETAFLVMQAVPEIVRREHMDRRRAPVEIVEATTWVRTLNGEPISDDEFLTLANAHNEDQGVGLRYVKTAPRPVEKRTGFEVQDDLDECFGPVVRLRDNDNCDSLIVGWVINHNVNRLALNFPAVDLNDAKANGVPSCRDAVDSEMRRIAAARKERGQ